MCLEDDDVAGHNEEELLSFLKDYFLKRIQNQKESPDPVILNEGRNFYSHYSRDVFV